MIRKCIKKELYYGIVSKISILIFFLLTCCFMIVLYLNYINTKSSINDFNNCLSYYRENNIDINDDLNRPYSIIQKSSDSNEGPLVENPLAYYKFIAETDLKNAHPSNSLSMFLETSFLYFPLVFILVGSLNAVCDFRNKTLKLKVIQISKKNYSVSKQLALFINCFIIMTAALICACIVNYIVYDNLKNYSNQYLTLTSTEFNPYSLFKQIIFAYFLSIFFASIGLMFGSILKNAYIGTLLASIYVFVIPPLGKYDLSNIIGYFSEKIYNFYGSTSSVEIIQGIGSSSIFILIGIFAVSNLIYYFKTERSSAFC